MGWLGENKVPYHISDHTSGLETLRPLRGFQREPHFLHLSS
jgi:hypothetical protein